MAPHIRHSAPRGTQPAKLLTTVRDSVLCFCDFDSCNALVNFKNKEYF